jgi:hypothetical protein
MNTEIPKRLTPTKETLVRLFAKSGNQCAFEGCTHYLFNEDGVFIAETCHIEAALTGGERFNKNMTNEERAAEENLVLLCHAHHKISDNVVEYTVERLKEIKRKHESRFIGKGTYSPNQLSFESFNEKWLKDIEEKLNQIHYIISQIRTLETLNHRLSKTIGKLDPSKDLFDKGLLYYTPSEIKSYNKLKDSFNFNKEQFSLITGHPSSGKTSFILQLGIDLNNDGFEVYYFQFSNNHRLIDIKDDIIRLGNFKAVFIFDDIHKNLSLAVELYNFIEQYSNISAIFVSRDISVDLQEIGESAFSLFEIVKNKTSLNSQNLNEKFHGIINKFKQVYGISESIGNLQRIIDFCNADILKLHFYLETWNDCQNRRELSEITLLDLNKTLRKKYVLFSEAINEDYLMECSALYSLGFDFHFLGDKDTKRVIENNGLIIESNADLQLYEFWHTKFAELILLCVIENQSGIDKRNIESKLDSIKESKVLVYLNRFLTNDSLGFQYPLNMLEIISSLSQQRKRRFLIDILSDERLFGLLTKYLDNETIDINSIKELIKHLRFNSPKHLELILERYLTSSSFTNKFEESRNGFDIFSYILISAYKSSLSRTASKITQNITNDSLKALVKSAPFNSLTLSTRLFKNYHPALAKRILNSLTIEEWNEKIKSLPPFILSNSLTEIKAIDPILANNILNVVDESIIAKRIRKIDFGHVEKIISELKEINSEFALRLYNSYDDDTFTLSLKNAEASQIGKGLVTLKILNSQKTINAYKRLDDSVILDKLQSEKIRNAFRIISELDKVDSIKTKRIIQLLISGEYLNKINDIIDFFTIIHNLESINFPNRIEIFRKFEKDKLKILLVNANPQNYASGLAAIKEFNHKLAKELYAETSTRFNIQSLQLTALGALMQKLNSIDSALTIKIFKDLSIDSFVTKANGNDINFSQVIKCLDELKNVELKHTAAIFEALSKQHSFQNKAYRVNIDLFMLSLDSIFKINPSEAANTFNIYKDKHKNDLLSQNIDFLKFCNGINKFYKASDRVALQLLERFIPKLKSLIKSMQFKELTTGLSDLATAFPNEAKDILHTLTIDELKKKALIIEKKHLQISLGELKKIDTDYYYKLTGALGFK